MDKSQIVPLVVSREAALQRIRKLAEENKFAIELHAREAMNDPDRNVSMRLVLETLKGGSINQGPKLDEFGDWRCRLRRRVAGRSVTVVVALSVHDFMYVVTVY